MEDPLTPKQKILLQIIKDYRQKHGNSPSLSELKALLGVPFINSVVHLLNKLEAKGYITKISGAERGIIPVENENDQTVKIPLVGAATCGAPSLTAVQNIEGYIPIDKTLLKANYKEYFFLKAIGDSMDLAGIDSGDLVLVRSKPDALPNERIVALIDEEATIKIYKPEKDFVILAPKSSNPQNKPIILRKDFTLQGIVEAVIKKEMLKA